MEPKSTTPVCFQCGSPLILMDETTEVIAGSLFPQTTKNYRCSNEECQADKDKQLIKRQQLQKEKTDAAQKRTDQKVQERKDKVAALTSKSA